MLRAESSSDAENEYAYDDGKIGFVGDATSDGQGRLSAARWATQSYFSLVDHEPSAATLDSARQRRVLYYRRHSTLEMARKRLLLRKATN